MSERKVLNKYFPPDFDPSIIPRQKKPKNDQYKVRLMAPFNMRCITCGVYIYKATKFNARKETVEGEEYLGIKIFRFYIRCPKCHQEITFKTDPENADYVPENGVTRNFELWREVEDEVEAKKKKKEDEEENNAMKALENRTKQSKKEMDMLDTLEEIRDMNDRNAAVDVNELIQQKNDALVKELQDQEKRDEEEIAKIFNSTGAGDDTSATDGAADNIVVPAVPVKVKRLAESDSDEGQSNVRKRPVFGQSDNPKTKKAKPGLAIHTITDHSELDIIPEIVTVSASTNAPRSKESVMKKKFNLGAMLGIVRKSEKPEAAVVKKSEKPEAAVSNVLAGLGGYGSSSEDSS